jgi:prepilin-type N-terminal cleavage/methylation domain-containing protein
MSIFSHWSHSGKRGFTLVELLVVISIMLILTSIFVLRQQRFQSSTLLRSLAYSVALSVRQAQVYGTSIRENAVGAFDTNSAAKAYGVYFSSGSPGIYILFADANNNGQYDNTENVQGFTLSNGYTINKFCATNITNTQVCSPTITTMTILFRRPNPDSCFASSASPSACVTGAAAVYKSGYIQLKSGTDTRSINVTLTGQITVGAQGS